MLSGSTVDGHAGFVSPGSPLYIDESDSRTPFSTVSVQTTLPQPPRPDLTDDVAASETPPSVTTKPSTPRIEEEIAKSLFDEDETDISQAGERVREVIARVRNRNARAVKGLKELYQNRCQITGERYTFLKRDGTLYIEAHHLTPLGEEGADSPFNIIIVSPLIHKMLHYAHVSDIDLLSITAENTLNILINDKAYTIQWHPRHAEFVRSHQG